MLRVHIDKKGFLNSIITLKGINEQFLKKKAQAKNTKGYLNNCKRLSK